MRAFIIKTFLLLLFLGASHVYAQQADPAGFIDPTQQQQATKSKKAKKPHRKIHWFWQKRSVNEMSQNQLDKTFKKSKRNIREENQTYRAHYKSTRRHHNAYMKRKRRSQQAEKHSGGHTKKKLKWG